MKKLAVFLILCLISPLLSSVYAQRKPDPNVGNPINRRRGIMDGNLVRTIFINWGEIAHHPDQPSGEWPKGSGHSYVDGVALIVQASAIDNTGQIIHPMETAYREFVDYGPEGDLWGWGPLPGYFNPRGDEPAMSDDPGTWPETWPDKPAEWDGFWNGFFGKGVKNADLESYFVFDDDPDEEWDYFPDATDSTRRGLGLEVSARLFQWSQVLAEDCIFAIYFITNEATTDYDSTFYVFYIDWGIGGTADSDDDTGDYNTLLDIAWAWDLNGFGTPGGWSPVGVTGFAFLESPGIENDGVDNDEDGLIDEKRDNGPGVWLDDYPYDVVDVDAFKRFYQREPKPHWSGDEDQDWRGFEDDNNNGEWDPGEALNDDVGADGIDRNFAGYTGPDEGEGDGIPTPGEPNFGYLDKDESDQIGLTGFEIFPVHKYELWNERQNWEVFKAQLPPHEQQLTANLGMFFSSGPFTLQAGQTKNYSMALIFADDIQDLARSKKSVQQIYNADYKFAVPPEKPKLIAVPGDNKVTLFWDDRAEDSYDPFLQEYDFEGYRIYRSTEPEFLETRLITDSYGRLTFRKPLVQFDLDNGIKGLHPVDVQGIKFNIGEDTGLRHLYIDTDVQNGQTYYYAVVSYDRGYIDTSAVGLVEGISPSECTSLILKDIAGNVQIDVNTAVITPNTPAIGYNPPTIEGDIVHEGPGTGEFAVNIILLDSIKNNHIYEVALFDEDPLHQGPDGLFSIYDITGGQRLPVVEDIPFGANSDSPLLDGFVVNIKNHTSVTLNSKYTGWMSASTNYKGFVDIDEKFTNITNPEFSLNVKYPSDFMIVFSDIIIDTSSGIAGSPKTPVKFTVYNVTEERKAKFLFRDLEIDSTLTPDTEESVVIVVDNPDHLFGFNTTWRFVLEKDSTLSIQIPPQPNDTFLISTLKPYRTGDKFSFKMKEQFYDFAEATSQLDEIAVVPNPYVATASWEQRSPFRFGRGERKIWFINLPRKCTIRIYSVRGYLVDTIEHDDVMSNGAESWDLISKDGMDIAFGVYVFHVDAPGVGRKIGKFAIIK